MTNSVFESPRATRAQILFSVKVNNSTLIDKVSNWEVKEMERVVKYASNVTLPDVDQMTKYLKNLIFLRVQLVENAKMDHSFKNIVNAIYVPARWYTLLDNLGEAHDASTNIKFVPVYQLDASDVLSAEDMLEISDMMQVIKPDGYSCVKGIPRHNDGSVEMMAKVALAEGQALDTIRGMKVDNPVFAFFANLFQMEVVDLTYADMDKMYRIEYSAPSIYNMNFRDYWKTSESEGPNTGTHENNDSKGPAQPKEGSAPPNLVNNGNGATN